MNYKELIKKRDLYINNKNKLDTILFEKIEKAFDIDFTYNSTTIEGNTLSYI